MCASGTAALHSLVNMHHWLSGKPIKWVTSNFGFACTMQGPLSTATIIDCDLVGMLDLNQIPTSCEGLVVTNIFGTMNNCNHYRNFCENGITLIVDSATAYDQEHAANEIVSFHQTKPWGMGEGGCAIIEKRYKELFKTLINFGITKDNTFSLATNGKISDIACALIYQRVEKMESLSPEYKKQYRRIADIAGLLDFNVLGECAGTPPHVPLVSPLPVSNLSNPFVKLQKYYRPQINTPQATRLYEHMVNFPCHPGVADLSKADIKKCLKRVLEQADIHAQIRTKPQ